MFSLIAAVGKNNELGRAGKLVFNIKEDMKYFKETTTGHAVFMGYNTYKSLPGLLNNRKNYIFVHNDTDAPDGAYPVTDLEKFISDNVNSDEEIFVIGGARVYSEMLPFCKTLYLTEINASADADVFFPQFDKTKYNKTIVKEGSDHDLSFAFAKYTKIN